MTVEATIARPETLDATWLCVGLFDDQDGSLPALGGTPAADLVARLVAAKELPTGIGDATPLHGAGGLAAGGLLAFGLGSRAGFDPGAAFRAGVAAAKRLAGKPRERVAVVVPEAGEPRPIASALVEGLLVGTKGPDLRKTERARHPFGNLLVVGREAGPIGREALGRAVERGRVVGEAVNLARDLVNAPPAEKPPRSLAARFAEIGAAAGVEVEVWDEDRIRRERLGGLLGVAAGSDQPPAFVRLSYRNGGPRPTLALVGKGVTFDSGGLSLKPSASMEDMKADMTGAAVVVAAFQAAARLALAANLEGFVPLTENLTGGSAMKLGDVLTIRNGTTVEVLNTDAEGRLILADALALAAEAEPGRIVDLATLTGACMVALGTKVAGLFSTDDGLAADVLAACRHTGERAWRLPLDADYDDLLKSPVADLKNVGGKWAGAVTAAKFLQRFVGSTPWAHLDIAGPSWADSESSTRDAGATGCFVRTLVAFIESAAAAS